MTAMFPASGVPWSEARNSLPDPATQHCDELWYSTSRCEPRFDPAAANAMLAELINLINKGEVVYDCNFLDQVQLAVRYLIQRGLPCAGLMRVGPLDYTLALDPALTRYNDHLTLIVLPVINNTGPVRVDIDNHGMVPVLRNDGQPLEADDLWSYIPTLISYWNGNFYVVGLVRSQVVLRAGALDTWIRTDGNDDTGDGTVNSAAKAFRTINGALSKVGNNFAVTRGFRLNLRLGIPGLYEFGNLSGLPYRCNLIGDLGNPGSYEVGTLGGLGTCLAISNSPDIGIDGITMRMNSSGSQVGLFVRHSNVIIRNCNFRQTTNSGNTICASVGSQSTVYTGGPIRMDGFGANMLFGWELAAGSLVADGGGGTTVMSVNNMNFTGAFIALENLSVSFIPVGISSSGVTGKEYDCQGNAVLYTLGQNIPGNIAGTVGTGGIII